ncbi:ATP synthase complex assembly protein atp12 [Ascosphaera aggregata]|nr:ATP synthase complex assembly protein atp12 [Ascosphaera aggregata]
MTGLVDRTLDVIREDADGIDKTRQQIVDTVMRYFDTDTLLSWAPGRSEYEHPLLNEIPKEPRPNETLRDLQIRTAQSITSFLLKTTWPGVTVLPAFEGDSILPTPQPLETRQVVQDWVKRLQPYDLAGIERATLASKSLLVATRLVIEWSENFRHLQPYGVTRKFGLEEAAQASTLEVTWQTKQWGEVEDTHDVDKEDVRRQLGSVVLLISGDSR